MKQFKNKKALVTGASRGIGKAIAEELCRQGCEVIIHYHEDEIAALQTIDIIRKNGGCVHLLKADLANLKEVLQLGEKAWKELNGIDFLINNAGVSYKIPFLETTLKDVNYFTDINFKGTLFLTQSIVKKMVLHHVEGSIYTITSINGVQPGQGFSIYGATKGALETLMKGIAIELAPFNIKVNTLAVGAIQTDINSDVLQDKELLQRVNENIPLGRMGQPKEIANLLCGILSSNTYMTGSTIIIDGGWLMKHGYQKIKR